MNSNSHTEAASLLSLTATERHEFLIRFAHGLTIGVRVLCHGDREQRQDLESVRLLNEGIHGVLGYLSSAEDDTQSPSWLVKVVE